MTLPHVRMAPLVMAGTPPPPPMLHNQTPKNEPTPFLLCLLQDMEALVLCFPFSTQNVIEMFETWGVKVVLQASKCRKRAGQPGEISGGPGGGVGGRDFLCKCFLNTNEQLSQFQMKLR